nr:hypothetical protein CFP56_74489 [Quercus suber]
MQSPERISTPAAASEDSHRSIPVISIDSPTETNDADGSTKDRSPSPPTTKSFTATNVANLNVVETSGLTAKRIDAFREYAEALISHCLSQTSYSVAPVCDIDIVKLRRLPSSAIFTLLSDHTRKTLYRAALVHLLRFRREHRFHAGDLASEEYRQRLRRHEESLARIYSSSKHTAFAERGTGMSPMQMLNSEIARLRIRIQECYSSVTEIDREICELETAVRDNDSDL